MTPRERQEAEIKTIKPRGITINLSDADVERLFEKAYSNGLTTSELIEGFLGDLLGGTYSHGSDERDLANEYFERCGYGMGAEHTFLRWALEMNYCDDIIDLLEDRDECLEIIADWEKDISSPEPREDMTLEEIKKEMAEDEEVLQSIQEELLSYYNEYAEYMKRRGEGFQPLEDGIEEIRQYHRALIKMRDSEDSAEGEKDCIMYKEKLSEKVLAEYHDFITDMQNQDTATAIESAYEIVWKDNIAQYIENEDIDLTEAQYNALLSSENTLDEIYDDFEKNAYANAYGDLYVVIGDTADRIRISLEDDE